MRIALIALIVTAPAIGWAQTPRDIANQIWPAGAPVSANQAPRSSTALQGGGTAADLARLTGLGDRTSSNTDPTGTGFVASFTAADLSRLRGDRTGSTPVLSPSPIRIVAR